MLKFIQIKNFIFPFYRDKDLKYIFKILQDGIPENKIAARFVGGCVRKHLLNEKIDPGEVRTPDLSMTPECLTQPFEVERLIHQATGPA